LATNETVRAITLKNIPDDLMASLKARAAEAQRSLSGEILYRLRRSLEAGPADRAARAVDEASIQADAWEALAGRWASGLSVDEEIKSLYAARSAGRDVDLNW